MPVAPVEVHPGKLITNSSSDLVGVDNYTVKRDFRRGLDYEMRREGCDYFQPDTNTPISAAYLSQSLNAPEGPILLVHLLRSPDGKVAIIAATATTIYRYFGMDNMDYFTHDPYPSSDPQFNSATSVDYFLDDYFMTEEMGDYTEWMAIGSGFSSSGNRWEAVDINGYCILNNGVDLPVTYRVQDEAVVPIYELREQGIASVGTIAEYNGILICGNVVQLQDGQLYDVMTGPYPYGSSSDVSDAPGYQSSQVDRYQYRLIWSMPSLPRRFAAAIPGAIDAGSQELNFQFPTKSFQNGQQVVITGAGLDGGDLTATVVYLDPSNEWAYIDTPALTTVDGEDVQSFDSIGSLVGYQDLQDDGSAVIKCMPLRTNLVVYKETSIFLGSYTAQATSPFAFQRVYLGDEGLYFPATLLAVFDENQNFHFYGGRNGFYRFDLSTLGPSRISHEVENLFFGQQAAVPTNNLVFASINSITKEIFLCCPNDNGVDNILCFDFNYNTVSTSSAQYTAAEMIKRPTLTGSAEDWFVMGTSAGTILMYGAVNVPRPQWNNARAIYTRLGQPYDSILQSGVGMAIWDRPLTPRETRLSESHLTGYILNLTNWSPSCPLNITITGKYNASTAGKVICSLVMDQPLTNNLVPCHYISSLYQETITVTGQTVNVGISSRVWQAVDVQSRAMGKQTAAVSSVQPATLLPP